MSDLNLSPEQINYILSPEAIRARAKTIYDFTKAGQGYFALHEEKFKITVSYVLEVIRKKYPDFNIPFHSRWGHFRAGGIDRVMHLGIQTRELEALERARVYLDLVIPSVLLDAGAGAPWQYLEESSKQTFNRSEGLGLASFYMFLSGAMSSDLRSLRADSEGLRNLRREDLKHYFQVTGTNPLLGVDGRLQLLTNLAEALENPKFFKNQRPGNLIDYLMERHGRTIPAPAILRAVIDGFGSIWPGRLTAQGTNLGDVWKHPALGEGFESLVPLHKLSQWMTYSLIEPMQEAGLQVTEVEKLTGLAEYRNGGLLIDAGILSLQNPLDARRKWRPDSPLIIEWRALTIYWLDRIGNEVRKELGFDAQQFPLAKVLEGGTWWAGRFLAKEKRENGDPPLQIESDGTVF